MYSYTPAFLWDGLIVLEKISEELTFVNYSLRTNIDPKGFGINIKH